MWDMRCGNPLESILHGIIRQNMGATHHMFGRDHANMDDFFDPYAVHVLWTRGLPSYGIDGPPHEVEGDLGLGLFCWGFAYCPKCGEWTFPGGLGEGSLCGHEVERVSGSLLRGFSWRAVGRLLWLCVLVGVVVKWWRIYGHPFVSVKYLRAKEEALEVL